MPVNGRPVYVRAACEASLRRLGVETIDLYYQAKAKAGFAMRKWSVKGQTRRPSTITEKIQCNLTRVKSRDLYENIMEQWIMYLV